MEIIKRMQWNSLKHEYGLDGSRLLPWDGWSMPFGGAWCVVRPNTKTFRHGHEEQEMFIAINGTAKIHIDEHVYPFDAGDIIAIPPNSAHYVENCTDSDFHFYTLWWDESTVANFADQRSGAGCG